jgi:hypothetical protein
MKFDSFYRGIVIQNNDPNHRGRVKILTETHDMTLYKHLLNISSEELEELTFKFAFMGNNIETDLTQKLMLEAMKYIPWAERAAPLYSDCSSGDYHAQEDVGTVTHGDSDGEQKPAKMYEDNRISDAFYGNMNSTDENKSSAGNPFKDNHIANVNSFSYNYMPEALSNQSNGYFNVPAVGSHLWVFFDKGNHNSPVYFASLFGKDDYAGIFNVTEENNKQGSYNYPGYKYNPKDEQTK